MLGPSALVLLAGAAAASAPAPPAVSRDGVPIHYAVAGRGEPALVFVHCWTCDGALWSEQVRRFSARHTVVTLDLAGHGRSGTGRKDFSIEAFGDDVAAVVERLRLRKVVLVGHSLGGPVILEAAARLGTRVVGLVPVDALLDVERKPSPETEAMLAAFEADFKGAADRFVRQYLVAKTSPVAVVERVARQAAGFDPGIGVAVLRSAWAFDEAAALRRVQAPIVAVNADLWPTRLDAARRHAPRFDAILVKGVGHYPMLEAPSRFADALAEAVRRVAATDR